MEIKSTGFDGTHPATVLSEISEEMCQLSTEMPTPCVHISILPRGTPHAYFGTFGEKCGLSFSKKKINDPVRDSIGEGQFRTTLFDSIPFAAAMFVLHHFDDCASASGHVGTHGDSRTW
jgi:hypothetical protein